MKDIYKTILAFEEYYSTESFYRKVIDILKNHEPEEAAKLLEDNYIPEKLLAATKYTELGYILYDYPNNIKQAQNLEQNSQGGINLAINLMLKYDLARERELHKHRCENCERIYYKTDLVYPEENVYFKGYFPKNRICNDCGYNKIVKISNTNEFESAYQDYESKLNDLLPYYNMLGLLLNFEVKNGLDDYNGLRRHIQNNIKH